MSSEDLLSTSIERQEEVEDDEEEEKEEKAEEEEEKWEKKKQVEQEEKKEEEAMFRTHQAGKQIGARPIVVEWKEEVAPQEVVALLLAVITHLPGQERDVEYV